MICIWCACFTKRALASYSPPLSHKEDFKERSIETTQIRWLTFSFSTLGLFIPHSQPHLLHRRNREGEKVTQHLSHARQTSTKTPSSEVMQRPTKLRGFHSVSVADRFSRWFRDGVSSVRRRRREEKLHTLILRGGKKDPIIARQLYVSHRCVAPLPRQVFWLRRVGHPGWAAVRGRRRHDKVVGVARTVG